MSEAGARSPHLERAEKAQAAEHAAPAALVIHEVVRAEGEEELRRRHSAVAWSGLAAGLSMGFSLLGLALLTAALPDAPWSKIVASFGYTAGFVITILGRQQLFTESTLTVVLPLLVRRDRRTLIAVVLFWNIVLAANLAGTTLFAWLLVQPHLFDSGVEAAMRHFGGLATQGEFVPTLLRAILSGWIIALMAWVLPSARSARFFVIVFLTYLVGLGGFSHVVAGSAEAAYAVFAGIATLSDYVFRFLVPTLIGNTIGGVALVALLNHAPLAPELQVDASEQDETPRKPKTRRK
jgi:formate/nitrite transporter FocA (FNT family)